MEIAGYEDLEEVGRGGYAVVFRAHEVQFGRTVAIKVLTSVGFGETDRSRFEREALAMGRLSWHPNIVVVHATGTTAAGMPYLVEEYLEGGSLSDHLRAHGPLAPADAMAAVVQLCAAAHAAHAAELLHRDIKPDNALVDAFGRVKLADFGIAAVAGSTLTGTGIVTATLAHAAPEVLNGGRATPAADVYGLGSTLFELLHGVPAFVRSTDESIVPLVVRATTEPVPDLRPAGVPEPVAAAVEAAMAKEPEDRPASALALGRLLQDAQQAIGAPVTELAVREAPAPARGDDTVVGAVTVAPPLRTTEPTPSTGPIAGAAVPTPSPGATVVPAAAPTPPPGGPVAPPAERADRRPRWLLLAGVVVVLAVVAGLVLVLGGGSDDPEQTGGEVGGSGGTVTEPTDAVIAVGDRPFRLAAAGDTIWVTNADSGSVSRIDADRGEVQDTVELGGETIGVDAEGEVAWVADTDNARVVRLEAAGGEPTSVAVGAQPRIVELGEGSVWVTNLADATVTRIDPTTGEVVAVIPVGDDPRGVVAGRGQVWVANYAAGTLSRIDAATNTVDLTVTVGGNPVSAVMTADSVWVADPGTDALIRLDLDGNELQRVAVGDGPNGMGLLGDDLYVSMAGDDVVTHFDATTGEALEDIAVGTAPAGVVVGEDYLWVANSEDDTVSRLVRG